jgi:hypothetical protein
MKENDMIALRQRFGLPPDGPVERLFFGFPSAQ